MLTTLLLTLLIVLLFLVSILFIILGERRLLAEIQGREGPSVVGFAGFWQTVLDGMKTFFKTIFTSRRSFKILFFILPAGLLLINVIKFIVLPVTACGGAADFEYDLMFLNILGSFEVFIFVFATWAALSSKFPTLAALREVAQQCAVEALTGFCFVVVALYAGTLSIRAIVDSQEYVWYFFVIMPYAYIYYLAVLAELHRTPSDLTEAESELTAGYQAEHGGILFSLFYLSEYGGIVVSSILFSLLFLGGWFLPLGAGASWFVLFLKSVLFGWLVIITRATLPRVRIKVLSSVVWSHLLPLASTALPFYLWVGVVCAVFRACEYCVLGVLRFRSYVKRIYYLGRNFWYTLPTTLDLRLDTSLGGFLFMRRFLDWGQYGKAALIGNCGAGYMTYPENSRLNDSIRLAGGLVTEGGRRQLRAPVVEVPEGEADFSSTILHPAQREAIYWQEALIGSPMKFFQYSSGIPLRHNIAIHHLGTMPDVRANVRMTLAGPVAALPDLNRELLDGCMPSTVESTAAAHDEWVLRSDPDSPLIPQYWADSAKIGWTEWMFHGTNTPVERPEGRFRSALYHGDVFFPYGGTPDAPKTSPSGFEEFRLLWGVRAGEMHAPFEKRFESWQADIEDRTLESFEQGELLYSPFYNQLIVPALSSEHSNELALGPSGNLYWSMAQSTFNTLHVPMRFDTKERGAMLAPSYWWDQPGTYSDEEKKYLSMAAFLDERTWDWHHYKDLPDEPVYPNNQGGPFNEYSYVPLGYYGYVAGPAGKPYYPDPIIFNYGAPSSERELPYSRHARPGIDPIANAARYRMVRSWYAQ